MTNTSCVNGTKMTFDELTTVDSHGTPRIMTLLREKLLNPENVSAELLLLKDESGMSVLDVCIERFREPVPDDREKIVPRALFLANKPGCKLPLHFRKVKEILRIAREDGWSVAHEMASQNLLPESMMTKDTLKLTTLDGCSVAYKVVWHNTLPTWAKHSKDILLLGNGRGDYVAHVLARHGSLPVEIMTEDILKLTNRVGCSVAYKIVWSWHDSFPDWAKHSKDILLLGNGCGDYVAHVLARHGHYLRK